jgi:uncharacterized membrane protein YvbJ
MFCATCGNSVNPDLRYCNSCGARISGADESESGQMSESSFNLLVSAILAIPIAGIGIMIGLLVVMKKELALKDELIAMIALMGFVLLLVSEGGLIWLLLHRTRAAKKKKVTQVETPVQLADVQMRGLNEGQPRSAQDSISSVTEHTTRTLDAVPLEREKR